MRQNVHSYTRAAEAVPVTGTSETAFYPDDLVSELQSTLAALTTLEIRHEIERDCLEEWSGPGEVKESLRAECELEYLQARAARLQRLARLQERVRSNCSIQ
jgi:hypothetical protein